VADIKKLTKMELALIAEADRLLRRWWPDPSTEFWIISAAKFSVLGARAELSASLEAECRRMLDQFEMETVR
jgi:hypothetical protein